MISVIIPVLNEKSTIKKTLKHLAKMSGEFETIVVDGGSNDETDKIARRYAIVVSSKRGRAIQMNTGAGNANGDILFFLHADCLPEKDAFLEVKEIVGDPSIVGGALRYNLDEDSFLYRNHVFWSNLRARLSGMYLGDHGIFVRRSIFDVVGGFPNIPLMEDIALCKHIKRKGKLVQARSQMTASSRRFQNEGFVRTVFKMWINRFLFFLGVSPATLARFYKDTR